MIFSLLSVSMVMKDLPGIVKHSFAATPLGDGVNLLLHQSSHPGSI
jgi:hypothetical protein